MNGRNRHSSRILVLAGSALLAATGASAQDGSSATTRSLNTAPPQTTLTPRPDAQPPLSRPGPSRAARPPARTLDEALADILPSTAETPSSEGVTLAPGQSEPEPIPMTLGYYVRGDVACDQAWPGEGNLAFATPTAFTLDYGGCEPGPWLQTGPNSWREEQRCVTESGGDAGGYSVTYQVTGTDKVTRTARLALDGSVEEDVWSHCATATLSENARFMS